jgi:putative nucleotidyltransferase with HDIG domain
MREIEVKVSERKVPVFELSPGMVLAEPVCHPFTQQVIWASGTTLTDQHIAMLRKMDLRGLKIVDFAQRAPDLSSSPLAGAPAPAPARTSEPATASGSATAPTPAAPVRYSLTRPSDARPSEARSAEARPADASKPAPPRAHGAAQANTPWKRPVPQNEIYKPHAVKHEVLQRNLSTVRQITAQAKQASKIDIRAVDTSVQTTIQRIVTNKELLESLIDLRVYDEYTYAHSSNVMSLALVVGHALGFPPEKLRILGIGALLHDIGKAMVPEAILHKPGKLTEEEFNIMATHPANGIMMLAAYGWATTDIKNIVFQHHEKFNGSGYPMKLSGSAISEMARIVSVVDVYDALISDRPYKVGLPPNVVYQAIINGAGEHFDPRIVQAFVRFIVPYPSGSQVLLNTGQVARVVRVSHSDLMRPVIELEGHMIDLTRDSRFAIVNMHRPAKA